MGLPMRRTKMDQDGHYIMKEQKCFKFVPSDLYDLFLAYMDTWNGIGVRASHRGVMGPHMRCTQKHQNGPKWTKMDTIAGQDKLFQICSK